jgi:hypothetical protein
MISVNNMGGLGNQLFMIFATLAYSIQHNVKTVIPEKNVSKRKNYWENFFSDLKHLVVDNSFIENFEKYQEPNFTYKPLPDFGEKDTYLNGNFQSYKYFESVQSTIFDMIHLSDKKREVREKYSHYFADKSTTSIHYRLGDYKHKRYYHPIMNYEYFEDSLSFVFNNNPEFANNARVLYLCEEVDNDYVEGQIKKLHDKFPNIEFVKVDVEIPDYDQMLIMSCCDHNIMSNSTFSWWGAYWNDNPNKTVCYPSVWFGQYFEHTNDSGDLNPLSWTKIEANPIHYKEPL